MDKFGLPDDTYFLIKNCLKQFSEIEQVKIFGSRAKGNFKPYSDIDLVLFGNNLTEKLVLHIKSELEELPTPYKFDVVDYKTITNDNFRLSIDNFGLKF